MFDQLVEAYPQAKTVALICPEDPGAIEMLVAATKQAEARGSEGRRGRALPVRHGRLLSGLTKLLASKPDVVYQGAGFAAWIGSILKTST